MTIEEHIKRAEEDALQAESDSDWGFGNYFIDRTEAMEYAKNCRQLAEWLKDYKRLLEQEPKTGHWIMTSDYYAGAIYYVECSCCHEYSLEEGNYCPKCGAKMAESEG